MTAKINNKNKIFIGVFIALVVLILTILVVSVTMSKNDSESIDYKIDSTSVLFNSDTNLVDTTNGGKIEKRWDGNYYFIQNDSDMVSDLGANPIIYNQNGDTLDIYGNIYRVFINGDVAKKSEKSTISLGEEDSFYKISDRVYLIVSDEIKSKDGSIYANQYVVVYIDKQGNASLLNDALNIKTINPMTLNYGEYSFDVANEALIVGTTKIDLKMVNGSSNEYVAKVDDPQQIAIDAQQETISTLLGSYNQLVSDFSEYVENNQSSGASGGVTVVDGSASSGSGTTSSGTTSGGTTSGGTSSGGNSGSGDVSVAANSTNLEKRISLRGAVAYPTYIDVTYIVTDPENKYQVVYLLVTGLIDGKNQTVKILLDKYITGYRITGLSPKNEYSISMGRIAVVTDDAGERSLEDEIEDVINVRTTNNNMKITIDKISGGKVYFTFKTTTDFAISSGSIVLYADDEKVGAVSIDYRKSFSDSGFSSSLDLINEAAVYTLRLEEAVYADSPVEVNVYRKFVVN